MRIEQEMTRLLSEVRHEVVNELTKLMFLIFRLKQGEGVAQEKLVTHEGEIKRIAGPYLGEEVEERLKLLRRKIHQDRKALLRRYLRRYKIQVGEGDPR